MFINPILLERITGKDLKGDNYKDNTDYYTEFELSRLNLTTRPDFLPDMGNEYTAQFSKLTNFPIPNGVILDCEIIVTKDGELCFESMMERFRSSKNTDPIQYVVFDKLYADNLDITNLPLSERKQLLKDIISEGNTTIFPVPYLEGRADDYFNQVVQHDYY